MRLIGAFRTESSCCFEVNALRPIERCYDAILFGVVSFTQEVVTAKESLDEREEDVLKVLIPEPINAPIGWLARKTHMKPRAEVLSLLVCIHMLCESRPRNPKRGRRSVAT